MIPPSGPPGPLGPQPSQPKPPPILMQSEPITVWWRTVKKVLLRLWAGVVGAILGGCVAFAGTVLLLMMGFQLNAVLWLLPILVIPGFLLGVVVGDRSLTRRSNAQQ